MKLGEHLGEDVGYSNWTIKNHTHIELGTKISSLIYLQSPQISRNQILPIRRRLWI